MQHNRHRCKITNIRGIRSWLTNKMRQSYAMLHSLINIWILFLLWVIDMATARMYVWRKTPNSREISKREKTIKTEAQSTTARCIQVNVLVTVGTPSTLPSRESPSTLSRTGASTLRALVIIYSE